MQYPVTISSKLQQIEEVQSSPREKRQFQIEIRLYQIQNELQKMDEKEFEQVRGAEADSPKMDIV